MVWLPGKGPGAAHAIDILRSELDRTLGLLGCCNLEELTPDLIHAPRWLRPFVTNAFSRFVHSPVSGALLLCTFPPL